jgi:hypothetical protein
MALKYLVDLDLGGNEVQNFSLQNLAAAPSSGNAGLIFFNTAANAVFVHNGSDFVRVGLTADGSTINESEGVISIGTIAISNVSGLQTALNDKVDDSQVLTNVPANAVFTDTTYSVGDGGLTQINFTQELLDHLNSVEAGATATYAPAIRDNNGIPALVTGITAAEVRTVIGAGTSNFNGAYSSLTGVPTTFAPSAHTHDISEINELIDVLDAKANLTDLQGLASTSYVDTAVAGVVSSAPAALDTLNELAAALNDDPNFATTITTALGNKLNASEYTAADVLAKIKTVDGAGSGLDADLLDGQSSAYYRNYNNLTNKPTIPVFAQVQVAGAGANTTIDFQAQGINSFVNVQIYDLNTGGVVLTDITQDGSGLVFAFLENGVDYLAAGVGAA